MSQEKIQSIKLNKFRGATQPFEIKFNLEKSMIMIFGENGTGKSTIVDAMDFIFNKECGSLKEKSSTKIKSHLPSLGSYSQDIEVSIRSQNYQWKGRLNGSNPEIKGNGHPPLLKILRRNKILELVNAEPRKRYEALKNFIELPHIRSSENSLRDCINDINRELHVKTKTHLDQENTLKQAWEGEGKPENNYLKWADKESKKQVHELKEKTNQYVKCIDLTKRFFESWDYFKEPKEKLPLSKNKLDIARQTLKKQSQDNQPEEIIDILQKTQSLLEKKESDECPACEQPIESEKLKERISVRLKNIQELITSSKSCNEAEKEYNIVQKDTSRNKNKFENSIKNMTKFLGSNQSIDEIKKIKAKFDKHKFLLEDQVDLKKEKTFFKGLETLLKELKDAYDQDKKSLNQLNLIKTSLRNLKGTKQKIKNLNDKKSFLGKTLQIVETQRKSYVENILNSISKDVEVLYSKLHPREGLDNIKLYLKPKAQGSLEIKSDFQRNADVPPQAYFSESHLDTLGICVFIATAKHFKSDVIVLDDVLTSVDQPHMERFIEILQNESKFFNQIILTTHYRRWRERYKFHHQSSSDIELIELYPIWSLEQGIRHSETKLAIAELENLKTQKSFDRQNVGSKTGVFLEMLLNHITFLYRLNVPRKPDHHYTLGELINSLSNKFIEKMKVKNHTNNEILLSNTMKELFNIAQPIRNQIGSHWNESGMDISDTEVISFLDITIKIGKTLICSACEGLPKKEKSEYWNCSCGKTSLYPLKK